MSDLFDALAVGSPGASLMAYRHECDRRMTPAERREALALLHWTQRGLAAVLGYSEGNVRRWCRDADAIVPNDVDEWLARMACVMLANPPPKRTTLRQPSAPSAPNGAKLPRNSANGD